MISKVQVDVSGDGRHKHPAWAVTLFLLLALVLLPLLPAMPGAAAAAPEVGQEITLAAIQAAAVAAAPAQTTTITLEVVNARSVPDQGLVKGEAITAPYEFIINVDNTGDPFDDTDCYAYLDPPDNTVRNPNYPDGCDWPGVHTTPGWSPIYSQGNQDDLNETTGIDLPPGIPGQE